MQEHDKTAGQPALVKLFEEMQALMWMMPVKMTPVAPLPETAERAAEAARAVDAEVEAGFDNMPV